MHNCAICCLAKTLLVELRRLPLGSIHPKGRLFLNCPKVLSGLVSHRLLLPLPWGLNSVRAAIFEGLKWKQNPYPLNFLFTYSWQVIALLFLEKTPWTSQKRRDSCSCILMQWKFRNHNYMNIVSLEHTPVAIWKENTKKEPNVYLVLSDFRGPRK